jgi:hypothetical protein
MRCSAARETITRATNGCSMAAQGLPATIGALELATVADDASTPCPRGTLRRVAGAEASLKDTCIAFTRALLARSRRASRNASSHPHSPDMSSCTLSACSLAPVAARAAAPRATRYVACHRPVGSFPRRETPMPMMMWVRFAGAHGTVLAATSKRAWRTEL